MARPVLQHRSLDFKGAAPAVLLSAVLLGERARHSGPDRADLGRADRRRRRGDGLTPELALSTLLVVIGIALTMAR